MSKSILWIPFLVDPEESKTMQALAIIPYTLTEKFMSDQEALPCVSEFSSLQTHKKEETRFFLTKVLLYISTWFALLRIIHSSRLFYWHTKYILDKILSRGMKMKNILHFNGEKFKERFDNYLPYDLIHRQKQMLWITYGSPRICCIIS